ncbi:MAG: hypothetical protein NC115_11300 [Bacteroidales bacterium]|nr:hypothetical protein [Bacteroidales bacterium]
MKRAVRYAMVIAFTFLVTLYMATTIGLGSSRRHGKECTRLEVAIVDSLRNGFVTRADIKSYIDNEGIAYLGRSMAEIDLVRIEETVDSRSAVLKSEAYMTRDGILNIEVTQRTPIVRFRKGDSGFYADKEGYLFPLQKHNPPEILVVDGNIPLKADSGYKGEPGNQKEKEWLEGILNLVEYINDHDRLAGNIARLHILGNGDIVIYPIEGKERFIFGKADNIEVKFKRIRRYYSDIVPEKGNGTYSSVNVKFDGQIICRK